VDPLSVDWRGADGRKLVESLVREAYRALENIEE
jgi:hypothetical protein